MGSALSLVHTEWTQRLLYGGLCSAQATVNTTKDYIGYYRDNEPTPPGM